MGILCFDPSLRAYGWAYIEGDEVKACGCISLKPQKGKLVSDIDTETIAEMSKELLGIITKYKPSEIIFENAVGSKSSRANKALSLVKGMTIATCICLKVPFKTVRAKSVKKNLTGDSDATKEEILTKVSKVFPSFTTLTVKMPKYKVYAASDAVAVYLGI